MRRPIERLADMIVEGGWLTREPDATLGEIAKHFDEPVGRIADALDVTKIKQGEKTYYLLEYGCVADCRADAGAGLHSPDCRVPPGA